MPDNPNYPLPPVPGPPASFTQKPIEDPYLNRLVQVLKGQGRQGLQGTDVKMIPWSDPEAGTNLLGRTPIHTGQSQQIELNPSLVAFPEEAGLETMVHELTHVNQNRGMAPDALAALKHQGATIPYEERPWEKQAFADEQKYAQQQGHPTEFHADPNVLNGMPLHDNVGKDSWHDFAVQQLINQFKQLGFKEGK